MARAQLSALRETIARIETDHASKAEMLAKIPLGHVAADAALQGGIARGALHEIYARERDAVSASAFAVMLASRISANKKTVLWVRQDFTAAQCGGLSAQGLFDLGIDPDRLLLVQTKSAVSALRAASDSLSCRALGAVVLEVWSRSKSLDLVASRKFSFRAARSGVTVFVIRVAAPEMLPSTAETRWHVRAKRSTNFVEEWGNPLFEATLTRNRHGQTGAWTMEWSCDDRVFREAPQNSRPVVPQSFHRPHQADAQTQERSVL